MTTRYIPPMHADNGRPAFGRAQNIGDAVMRLYGDADLVVYINIPLDMFNQTASRCLPLQVLGQNMRSLAGLPES